MKNFVMLLIILIVVAAVGWFVWLNWGAQLSHLPGQLSSMISRMLTGMVDSLAGLGSAVRDSFRMPGR